MLRVETSFAKIGIRDQAEMEGLVSYLRTKGYSAIVRSMFTGMFDSINLPEPDEALITTMIGESREHQILRGRGVSDVLGDIFITDDIIYVLNPIEEKTLESSAIGYEGQEESLEKFCGDIEEGIKAKFNGRRLRGMEFGWERERPGLPGYIGRRYSWRGYSRLEAVLQDEPLAESVEPRVSEPNYSSEDTKAANLLVDEDVRQFILRLAQVGKMTSKDAVGIPKKRDTLKSLLSLDLMAEEYLLTCKKDQHTICVVASSDLLTQEPMASLRCSCGRAFPEENLQLIYTLTERGRRLIDGSLWMSIWITELLKENGVRKESIKWGFEASGEELDIMVEDFNSRIFLELKDREFGLGDAYPFIARLPRYGSRFGIVVTTEKVAPDAKNFFDEEGRRREHPIRIQYLEGTQNIPKGFTRIVEEMVLLQVQKVIRPFSIRTGFNLWPIVEYWINRKKK